MVTRKGLMGIGMAAILASGLCGCLREKPAETQERPPAAVQTALAIQTNVPRVLLAFGRIAAAENVDIIPQVTGKHLEAHF